MTNSITIIGGENGMNGDQFFLGGEEVAPTVFFSSAYDPQYHTANGIEVPDGVQYAPQLAAELVDLFEQPHTIVLDSTRLFAGDSEIRLFCDEAVYFEVSLDGSGIFYLDNTAIVEVLTPGSVARHKLAVTHANGSVSVSMDGGAVISAAADPTGDPITTVVIGVRDGAICHELTIMDPQPDAALPALSAL